MQKNRPLPRPSAAMSPRRKRSRLFSTSLAGPLIGALAALALSITALARGGDEAAGLQSRIPQHPDTRTITHVLNRVTFGPRPGDVERVQAMGLSAYLEQQLHPEQIDDSALDARLKQFETLDMSTADLAQKYFLPALQLRRDQQIKQQRAAVKEARTRRASGPGPEGEMQASAPDGADMLSDAAGPRPATAPAQTPPALSPEMMQAQAAQRQVVSELMQAKMIRAAESNRQLEEVMADFWLNHFNVFVGKGQVRDYLTSYDRDVIRPHALGRFRDLLGAVAHSPAMLFYLDNWQSSSPDASPMFPPNVQAQLNNPRLRPEQRARIEARLQQMNAQAKRPQRGINENYARELMELHTLGVDAGYTQADVIALAKILTGWTIDRPQQGGSFVFRPQMHDTSTKTFLGATFKADGENEGERALDLLASRPETAHHIAYELAQRFVADEPPPALVDRAAKRFLDTKGDLREVVRTIVTSPEFLSDDAYRAKVKTPLEFVVSALRVTDTNIVNGQPLIAAMQTLGMPLYGCQPPTGYSMTADAWVNTGALINRMNFSSQLLAGGRPPAGAGRGNGPGRAAGAGQFPRPNADAAGAPGVGGGLPPARQARLEARGLGGAIRGPLQVDVAALAADVSDGSRAQIIDRMLAGDVSEATRSALARATTPETLVTLALGSPEFQRR